MREAYTAKDMEPDAIVRGLASHNGHLERADARHPSRRVLGGGPATWRLAKRAVDEDVTQLPVAARREGMVYSYASPRRQRVRNREISERSLTVMRHNATLLTAR
ncbi:MAG: hypothetical protein IKG21_01010, partial [Atopobiaceae bacterium]|nr:hypothetical protein [Atopobiaceae bacterium]